MSASDRGRGPILIATDFSEDAEAAFAWAAEAALAYGAPLHVLHVVHDPVDDPGAYSSPEHASLTRLEDVGRELLAKWLDRKVAERWSDREVPLQLTSSIAVGLPETRILEVAERERARLIVIGGRGQSRLADILLGSRAERVARRSPIPVTIVRDSGLRGDSAGAGEQSG